MRQHWRPVACLHCPHTCAEVRDMQRHVATHFHREPFACPWCDLKIMRWDNFQRHLGEIHGVS